MIDAADNWVVEVQRDAGRLPNENEWQRLRTGPLDGQIGRTNALQDLHNVAGGASEQLRRVGAVRDKPAGLGEAMGEGANSGKPE